MTQRPLASRPFVLGCAALAVLLAFVASGCRRQEAPKSSSADLARIVVTVSPVTLRPVQRAIDVVGTLHGDEEATISAKVSGRVVEILHDVGDRLAPAEPLARIDRTDYQLSVQQREAALSATLADIGLDRFPEKDFDPELVPTAARSKAELANAAARYARAKSMFEEKPPTISEQDYSDQKTAFDVAKSSHDVALMNARALLAQARTRASELEQARQALVDTTIRAPGEAANTPAAAKIAVASRLVAPGEYVREGTAMFRLVDADPIKFRADVPERYIGEIHVDQVADVTVQAYEGHFHGRVARIAPQINASNRTFQVEIDIDNGDGRLKPGGFARGSVQTSLDERVTFIPQEAVLTYVGVTKCFAIRDGKAVECRISTGVQEGTFIEAISTDLSPTDQVAVSGVSRLTGGALVQVKSASELTAAPIDPRRKAPSNSAPANSAPAKSAPSNKSPAEKSGTQAPEQGDPK
jgi:RND family efflux transporter MFP subunit